MLALLGHSYPAQRARVLTGHDGYSRRVHTSPAPPRWAWLLLSVAGAIALLPGTRLVITEGNYLLLDDDPWAGIAKLLDDCWYVEIDPALRTRRLVARHRQFGRSAEQAADWVAHTDEPNARHIEATRERARAVFRWSDE